VAGLERIGGAVAEREAVLAGELAASGIEAVLAAAVGAEAGRARRGDVDDEQRGAVGTVEKSSGDENRNDTTDTDAKPAKSASAASA
jgi:hypothetical protein